MRLLKSKAPKAPSIQILRWLNRSYVEGGTIWQEAVVRLSDGTIDLYEIPTRRVGGTA